MERNWFTGEKQWYWVLSSPSILGIDLPSPLLEGRLVRCSLATNVVGVSDWDERCTNQLHHFYCGDVRQCGEPLVCGTSVSRFESDTSHQSVT